MDACRSRRPLAPRRLIVSSGARHERRSEARRKVVTALFCDVTGSTALGEELDPEALHAVMNRYWRELQSVIERHGGAVEKFMGDAVMAVFGIPRVHEDDALRAVRAAAEIRDRLPAVAEEAGVALTFRTAVNTGLVLVGEGANLAIGDAVNVAARLEQAAAPGEILLGTKTRSSRARRRARSSSLKPLVLKGKSDAGCRVSAGGRRSGCAGRCASLLTCRSSVASVSWRCVRAAWERTVEESGCHLFTLLGAAGVGKSRLVSELFAELADEAHRVERSLPALRGGDHVLAADRGPVAGRRTRRRGARASRHGRRGGRRRSCSLRSVRLLESLASDRPVILHIDDLQWAESMLLDLIDHIVGALPGRADPSAVLGASRAPGGSPDLGRRKAQRHHRAA